MIYVEKVTKIQSLIRRRLSITLHKKLLVQRMAVRLQTAWRKQQVCKIQLHARAYIKFVKNIQAFWRKRFQRLGVCVTKIQSCIRRFLAQRCLVHLRYQKKSAIRI